MDISLARFAYSGEISWSTLEINLIFPRIILYLYDYIFVLFFFKGAVWTMKFSCCGKLLVSWQEYVAL